MVYSGHLGEICVSSLYRVRVWFGLSSCVSASSLRRGCVYLYPLRMDFVFRKIWARPHEMRMRCECDENENENENEMR